MYVYKYYFFWLIFFYYICRCGEFLYNIVLGIVFIFCYFNPKDSPTRRRFTFYYTLTFLENSALMCAWFIYCPPHVHYRYPAMFLQFLSFVLGLVVMVSKSLCIFFFFKDLLPNDVNSYENKSIELLYLFIDEFM